MSIPQQIADGIKKAAGGTFHLTAANLPINGPEATAFHWFYNCPCGEVSGYSQYFDRCFLDMISMGEAGSRAAFVAGEVETALECMRRHIRSEGNTPSF